MGSQKFQIGDRVRIKRYPRTSKKVSLRYGGKVGRIRKTRHIKKRLWYDVIFSSHRGYEDADEFTSNELTRI